MMLSSVNSCGPFVSVLNTFRSNIGSCHKQLLKRPPRLFLMKNVVSSSTTCPFWNRICMTNESTIFSLMHKSSISSFGMRYRKNQDIITNKIRYGHVRFCSNVSSKLTTPEKEEKLSLMQRFKKMYKEYWYVLVPVHLVTSAIWFSSFYYLAKSGVDIASFLENVGAGESLIEKLRNGNSKMGYIAIAYALYKIATPARYTVTLGGTTISIKYLKEWGYIKPVPPKDKLKEIMHEKKNKINEKKENLKMLYKNKSLLHRIAVNLRLKKNSQTREKES